MKKAFSLKYPKTFIENLAYRADLLLMAKDNKLMQGALKMQCRLDRLFFYNVFMFTYDPRRVFCRNVPFITYPFQDKAILWDAQMGDEGKDNLFEKSRDMGMTWICVGNDLHDWLFKEEKIEIRWGSRKEDYVDKRGDMDAIFPKFRHALRYMPVWMLPDGFNWKKHDNHMRLINPETHSSLSGESTNEQFGRGGRKYRIRFDEFAFWDSDVSAWQSCADATNCRTALSTPNGPGNKFAILAKGNDITKYTLHWTLHPEKQKGAYILKKDGTKEPIDVEQDPSAAFNIWLKNRGEIAPKGMKGGIIRSIWYDHECGRREDSEVAEELDIDYLRSGRPFFDLRSISKQIEWEELVRDLPSDKIPRGKYIKAALVDVDNKIEIREEEYGWIRLFEMPKRGSQYVNFGDTAEGLAKGDHCFGCVRDKYTRNVVATYNGEWDPDDFALKMEKVSKLFNKALTAPENNNHGYSVCSDLKTMDCNLYWTTKRSKAGKVERTKAGWSTTATTRPIMLDQGKEDIKKDACEVRCPVILGQMKTFVRHETSGKPQADGSFLDDGVISFCGCGAVIQEYPYKYVKNVVKNMTKYHNRPKNGSFKFGRNK